MRTILLIVLHRRRDEGASLGSLQAARFIQIPGRAGESAVSGFRLPLDFPSVAPVLLRKAEFLQLGGHGARVEDGAEVRLHSGEDLGPGP